MGKGSCRGAHIAVTSIFDAEQREIRRFLNDRGFLKHALSLVRRGFDTDTILRRFRITVVQKYSRFLKKTIRVPVTICFSPRGAHDVHVILISLKLSALPSLR